MQFPGRHIGGWVGGGGGSGRRIARTDSQTDKTDTPRAPEAVWHRYLLNSKSASPANRGGFIGAGVHARPRKCHVGKPRGRFDSLGREGKTQKVCLQRQAGLALRVRVVRPLGLGTGVVAPGRDHKQAAGDPAGRVRPALPCPARV